MEAKTHVGTFAAALVTFALGYASSAHADIFRPAIGLPISNRPRKSRFANAAKSAIIVRTPEALRRSWSLP